MSELFPIRLRLRGQGLHARRRRREAKSRRAGVPVDRVQAGMAGARWLADANHLTMSEPIKVEFEYGLAWKYPVQAEGRINGHPFYFRSRGAHWSIEINPFKSDPVDYCGWTSTECCWSRREVYKGRMAYRDDEINDGHRFAAGWDEEDECREFIEKSAAFWWRDMQNPPLPQRPIGDHLESPHHHSDSG